MIERAIIKSNAKQQLKGKWGLAIGSILVAELITKIFSGSANLVESYSNVSLILNLGELLLGGVMTFGIAKFTLNMAIDKESAQFTDIFSGFSLYLKTLGLFLLMGLCVLIGIILLIIPGIIIALMFSQAYYLLCDNNDMGVIECLQKSSEMMKGHKGEYFVLELSFIGWWIGVICTLGIGALWLMPYQELTKANYYLALKNGEGRYEGSPYR